jgi:hypothetical protein
VRHAEWSDQGASCAKPPTGEGHPSGRRDQSERCIPRTCAAYRWCVSRAEPGLVRCLVFADPLHGLRLCLLQELRGSGSLAVGTGIAWA